MVSQQEVHDLAVSKGWYDSNRSVGDMIALCHSELSEALESYRSHGLDEWTEGDKPEGFGIELADCIIRILDMSESLGINIQRCVSVKHAYNKTRPYRHGNKKL